MSAPPVPQLQQDPLTVLPPELWPSVEHLKIEDDTPVDSIYSEKQMRLLTSPLYTSWPGPAGDGQFVVMANVGMFFAINQPPLVPDVLLSLGVRVSSSLEEKRHRSYFFWEFGKAPDAIIEIVSNDVGGELGAKKDKYADIGIPFYIVWDPLQILSTTPLQAFVLHGKQYQSTTAASLSGLRLGLQVWHGTFEQLEADWLRWCDAEGKLIPRRGTRRAGGASRRRTRGTAGSNWRQACQRRRLRAVSRRSRAAPAPG